MAVKIFCCYAREDEALLNKLKTHLRTLQRQGVIDVWHDRDISAGTEWEREISEHLNSAQIILLLVSPDFLNSDYCYGIEMKHALERHERGEALVIPIILRPVLWENAPFSKLQALPRGAKHVVTGSLYTIDHAFVDVVEGIRQAIKRMTAQSETPVPISDSKQPEKAALELKPRSDTAIIKPRSGLLKSRATLSIGFVVLSGASGKFRPLLATVQCRVSGEADVAGVDPTHRDVCAHSSRPSLIVPPPQSLSRSRSVAL